MIEINVRADGQRLTLVSAPTIASASIGALAVLVDVSGEWIEFGWPNIRLAVRHGGIERTCEITDGRAVVDAETLAQGGALEIALIARNGEKRLTSTIVTLPLEHSGKEVKA